MPPSCSYASVSLSNSGCKPPAALRRPSPSIPGAHRRPSPSTPGAHRRPFLSPRFALPPCAVERQRFPSLRRGAVQSCIVIVSL
ncbi:MAG: hypothetical protein IK126_00805 [Bacteroidales bacterium]|nr:hypothetical protein [Bacteroidales bacterium]